MNFIGGVTSTFVYSLVQQCYIKNAHLVLDISPFSPFPLRADYHVNNPLYSPIMIYLSPCVYICVSYHTLQRQCTQTSLHLFSDSLPWGSKFAAQRLMSLSFLEAHRHVFKFHTFISKSWGKIERGSCGSIFTVCLLWAHIFGVLGKYSTWFLFLLTFVNDVHFSVTILNTPKKWHK